MAIRPAILLLLLVGLSTPLPALDIAVDYGHRHLHEGWTPPPAEFQEGAVTATFAATAPIDTAFAQPGLERVDARTWRYDFAWDQNDTLAFHFVDDEGLLHEVRTAPAWLPFVPGEQTVPVVALDLDPSALWKPAPGIYVWGDGDEPNWDQRGEEWERAARFRWYDRDGSLQHDRTVGVRINGNFNRQYAQKSLRLYFDHHGDPETIVDDFFGSPPYVHERLILRASSTRPTFFLRDVLAGEIFARAGHERSRWTPAEVYLSQEYWGLYHLRERPDDEWAERTLGLSGDYVMIKDSEAVHGDLEPWYEFLAWAAAVAEPAANEFYVDLDARLDLASYLDWVLLQCWSATTDNGGGSNVITVRPAAGPWRFIVYDQDGSFGTSNLQHDFFRFFAAADQAEFADRHPPVYYPPYESCRPYFDLWRQAMGNARCRRLARQRWQALHDGVFSYPANVALLDSMVAVQQEAAARHQVRWSWTNSLPAASSTIKYVIAVRRTWTATQFAAFMDEWMDPVELDVFTVGGESAARLSWHTERELDCAGWRIDRRLAVTEPWQTIATHLTHPDSLAALGGPAQPADYAFTDDTLPCHESREYRLAHVDGTGGVVVHPWVEAWGAPPVPPGVVVNEFLASNASVNADETGAFEDWVELYNAGGEPLSLDDHFLTDDLDEPLQWPLPSGLTLEPGGFLLIWCDDDPEDGPLHATFKLSADGECVALFRLENGAPVLVDGHAFGPQITDVSEGRHPDGGPDWLAFATPTPGASNVVSAVSDAPRAPLRLAAWPNPFNPFCRLAVQAPATGPLRLAIHDVAGRRVRLLYSGPAASAPRTFVFTGRDDRGARLASGVYQAVLSAGDRRTVAKLVLVQ